MGLGFGYASEPSWYGNARWNTSSKKDPRFTMSGYAQSVTGASFVIDAAILKREKELGVEAPDDIEVSAWKD